MPQQQNIYIYIIEIKQTYIRQTKKNRKLQNTNRNI